jgi:alkylation response protein AidB-like acyl-CoA dehydrogenase
MRATTHQSLGAAALVAAAGTPEQRARLLPRMAAGELAALAVSEAGAGADLSLIAATARRARGGYRLSGRKLWVSNAADARWLAVLARAPGGPALFVVDARARGVVLERRCRFLGLRGLGNAVVRLSGAFVPEADRVGAEGDGARLLLALLGAGRLTVVPRALGLARECRRAARAWAAARRQRGRALAAEPAVAARLARLDLLVVYLEALDARVAAWAQAGRAPRVESALAKLFAAAAAWEAADATLQLRGARGYETADSQRARGEEPVPAERWLRDARGLRLIEGSDDALRWAVARRGLELARAGARAPRAPGPLGRRAVALAAELRTLARSAGGEVPARALELADEAARLLAESA